MRVLILEDDVALGQLLAKVIALEKHTVEVDGDGRRGLDSLLSRPPDLLVLDLGLPGMDGLEILARIQGRCPRTAVLVLTGRSGVESRVQCLNLGADDCLPKPFSFNELTARCRALLRRREKPAATTLRAGDIQIDRMQRTVTRHGRLVELTFKNRLLLNLGGIANITALPAGCDATGVLAFDTGPANMVIDACMQHLYGRRFDADGLIAARGKVLETVISRYLLADYFALRPPKSCGREEYGESFFAKFLHACEKLGARKQDVIATATAFTAATILDAYARFCWPHLGQRAPLARATELFAAGGGARNATLMKLLTEDFAALGVKVSPIDATGIAAEAKEAAAFALLGWLTWHGLPGNIPSATGAKRAVVLGKVTYAA